MAKRTNLVKVLAAFGVGAIAAGAGIANLSASATTTKTIGDVDVSSFQMEYGASVRIGDDVETGIRFKATLSDEQYTNLEALEEGEGVAVNYGVLIVPADKFGAAELTVANIFESDAYCLEQECSCTKTHLAAVEYDKLANESATDGVMNLRGSLEKIQQENLTREFVGLAYIEYSVTEDETTTSTYVFADYALPVDEDDQPITDGARELANTTRSMTYVAQKAIEDEEVSTDEATTLTTDYITPLTGNKYKYTIKHHLSDSEVVEETLYAELNTKVTAANIAKSSLENKADYASYATYGTDTTKSNASGIVYANGKTVLNNYYVYRNTVLFDGSQDSEYLKNAHANANATVTTVTTDPATNEAIDALTKVEVGGDKYGAGHLKLALPTERIEDANSANWDYLTVRMYVEKTDKTDGNIDLFSWTVNLGSITLNTWVDFVIPKALLNDPLSYVINSKTDTEKSKTEFDSLFVDRYNENNASRNFFYTNSIKDTNSTGEKFITYYIDSITWGVDVQAPEIQSISRAHEGAWIPEIVVVDDIIPNTTYSTYSWGPSSSYVLYSVEDDVRTKMTAAEDGSYNMVKGTNYVLSVTMDDSNATDVTGNVHTEDVNITVYDKTQLVVTDSKYDMQGVLSKVHDLHVDLDGDGTSEYKDSIVPTIWYEESITRKNANDEDETKNVIAYQSRNHKTTTYGGYFYLNLTDAQAQEVIDAFNSSDNFKITIVMCVEVLNTTKTTAKLVGAKNVMSDEFSLGKWVTIELTKENLQSTSGGNWTTDTIIKNQLTGSAQFFYLNFNAYSTAANEATTTYYIDSISYSF